MSVAQIQPPLIMTSTIRDRINSFDWPTIHTSLHASGWARTGEVLTHEECRAVRDLYTDEARFRSKVVMARHRFGLGEYKYFGSPLPELVVELRESLYTHLAAVANEWAGQLDLKTHYPATHREFIRQCHARGQKRPTPLLLRYESGGYNCLEFVLVEQRPRAQSSAQVIAPRQGEGVIFTTRWRPVRGTRGHYRVNIKHGVSTVTRGLRHTLGIVYHDAE